ncbi:MAG TPA: HEAT repeat domain-containing protein, partial [bacterium]|nr:HEAT repeat domain-containing protein [bacterium]
SYRHLLSIDMVPEVEVVIRHQMILTLCAMGNLGAARRAALTLIQTHRMDQDLLMQLCDAFMDLNSINPAKEILGHIVRMREEYLPARQKFIQILNIENQIEALVPGIYAKEEEYALRYVSQLMRFGHEKVAKALLSLRGSESALIRQCVVEYYYRFGYLSWGEITDFLQDSSALVRCKAAEYLTRFGPSNMAPAMARALQDESDVVRACAARFLKQHGTGEMLVPLKKAIEQEEDAGTRLKIRAAITAIQRRSSSRVLSESLGKSEHLRPSMLDQVSVWAFCSLLAGLVMLAGWMFFRTG